MENKLLVIGGTVLVLVLLVLFIYPGILISTPPFQEDPLEGDSLGAVITLERTPCFGFCPIYKLTISEDGTVFYEGDRYVNVTGNVTYIISKEKVVELVRDFQKIDYFSLNDTREGDVDCATDGPSVITSLTLAGKTKTVHNYHGCPSLQSLRTLEDKIDEIVESEKLILG